MEREPHFDEKMDGLRIALKTIGAEIDSLKKEFKPVTSEQNVGEIMANLTLAYRHVEDASMRIGKVKQHINNGESIYGKNVVGSK